MKTFTPFALLLAVLLGTGCARPTEPNAPSADVLTGDAKALQGSWGIVSVEDGYIENLTGAAKKDAEAMMKDVRLVFDGYRMTIIEKGEDEPVPFTLDEAKNPRVMTLQLGDVGPASGGRVTTAYGRPPTASRATPANRPATSFGTSRAGTFRGTGAGAGGPARPAETWRWIYKIDGDMLTIAFVKRNKTLVPTEFKARAESNDPGQPAVPGVTVITLKRTNEPLPVRPRAGTQLGSTRPLNATAQGSRPGTGK